MNDQVVITGAGLVTALGTDANDTWNALLSGKSGISLIDDFNVMGFDCKSAAQVQGLGPEELGVHPRDSRIMDKHAYMLLKATRDAFRQSSLDTAPVEP